MYAVVRTGGKQYKVALGDRLRVDRMDCEAGDSVGLDEVLMVADGEMIETGTPTLDTRVAATVVAHGRSDKIKVFKMRRRKNYRRTQGHRQDYTELQITAIGDQVLEVEEIEGQFSEEMESDAVAESMTETQEQADQPESDAESQPDSAAGEAEETN